MNYSLINIKTCSSLHKDIGNLSFFEAEKDLPFEIKRVYYTYGVKKGETRGFHSHKTLHQLLVCVYGSITVALEDGHSYEEVHLDDPSVGLLIGPGVWHTMKWLEDDSVLCVAASDYYDAGDYIRDYYEFLDYAENLEEKIES